jgi:hypothetical protein
MKTAHQGLPVADLPGVGNRVVDPSAPPATIPATTPSAAPMTSLLAPAPGSPLGREDDMRPVAPLASPASPPARPQVAVVPQPSAAAPAPVMRTPAPRPPGTIAKAAPPKPAHPKPPASNTASLDAFILDRVLQQR